ncbi:MAG: hypothetical protein EOP53_07120 [Sphingobacteriales bacterium]|nr:MAG: hypothetical protein EOP53_07120 [Sphingobacteriales bacterium]
MKLTLILSLILLGQLANAQIKLEPKVINSPVINGGSKKPPVIKNGPKTIPSGSRKPGDLSRTTTGNTPRIFERLNPIENNMGRTKVSTYLVPVDKINSVNRREPKPKKKEVTEKDGYLCQNYSVTLSPESQSFDAPLAEKMSHTYPGAAYNYRQYISNNVQPQHLKSPRNPIILQVSSSSGSGKKILVADPTKDMLEEAVGQLKGSQPKAPVNLSTEITVQTIVNDASFALNVEAGGGGYGFKANAAFGLNYSSKKTYMSIDYKQKNFVITAFRPDTATGGFFKTEEENAKNENMYMSSVTYGRRVIGVIETENEQESMNVSADISYNGFGASANLGLGILNKLNTSKTTVRLMFIGGDATMINVPNPTEASVLAAINNWVSKTTTQAAVPIEYTFKNMNDVGMRWESVTSNITWEQCVPLPPPGEEAQPWDISFTLNDITNNKKEKVKLGISQSVGIEVNGKWINENSGQDKPILCWMEDWKGCQVPPHIDFNIPHQIGTTRKYTISNDEFQTNPLLRIETKRIVMYATGIGGSKNANDKTQRLDKRIKDFDSNPIKVPVHVNGRIFTFNYTVTIRQRPGVTK